MLTLLRPTDRLGHRRRVQSGPDVCFGAHRHSRHPSPPSPSFPLFCFPHHAHPAVCSSKSRSTASRTRSRMRRASRSRPRCVRCSAPALVTLADFPLPVQDITVKKNTDEIHIIAHHNAEDKVPAYRRMMWLRRVLPGITVKVRQSADPRS